MVANADESLRDLKKFQLQYSREDFKKKFDHPFLVFNVKKRGDKDEQRSFDTVHLHPSQLMNLMQGSLLKSGSSKVIRLIKKGAKDPVGMINVGRADVCDVVIKSAAVSKFHAYFAKELKSNNYYLSDAGSTNGTFVNDVKLKPKEKKILNNGDAVSFGRQIDLLYYTAEGCFDLLKQMPSSIQSA